MKIKDHIKANNYTQADAARAWGVSRQLVRHWCMKGAIVIDGRVYLPVKVRKCA